MIGLALQPGRSRSLRVPARDGEPVLAQRRSTLAGPSAIAAPPIRDAGRPLEPATRAVMESGFGRDLGHVRIHDDALAHDRARDLGALAYAAGSHIVFGEGSYRPGTPTGDALIAHEVAHTVQQAGVQLKPHGALPLGLDAGLEAEADRAAAEVISGKRVGALTSLAAPAVYRSTRSTGAGASSPTPAGGAATTPPILPAVRLPTGMAAIRDNPPGIGTNELVVEVTSMTLPRVKGAGSWVRSAYREAGDGGRLVFSPLIQGGRVAAFKEDSGTATYSGIWHRNFGFASVQDLGRAILAARSKPEVAAVVDRARNRPVFDLVNALATGGLSAARCDIDHIVEKQIGGTSIPSNLQLLLSSKNQESGRQTYQSLKNMVEEIRSPANRGPAVTNLQLVFRQIVPMDDTSDPSFEVETLLRSGHITGNAAVAATAAGSPVMLSGGGVGETVRVQDRGTSDIPDAAKRILPGMRLLEYTRGAQGPRSRTDRVSAELDNRAIRATGASDAQSRITLNADLEPASAAAGAGAGGTAATENSAAGERRVLRISNGPKRIRFFYPYLSPGYLTRVELDAQGRASGEGHIEPSVRFLGNIRVAFGPERLDMVAPIDVAQMNASRFMRPVASFFRFTSGQISIDLIRFRPEGSLGFSIGPAARPLMLGTAVATVDNGAFAVTGTLTPAGTIPGIQAAAGTVRWRSDTGWSGEIQATSAAIPNSTVDARIGFREREGRFQPFGDGGIRTRIGSSELNLRLGWTGGPVTYSGGVTVRRPMPFVDEVRLTGSYAGGVLRLSGRAPITWRNISAEMNVGYVRRDGDAEGRFSGSAEVRVRTAKAEGSLALNFAEDGSYSGRGSLSYQVTPNIRPRLQVELTRDRRVKVSGEVAIGDVPLTRAWPRPGGERRPIIRGVGVKFPIPVAGPVTIFGEIRGSLGIGYAVGPVMLRSVVFSGEAYPLEDDPQIRARLTGTFAVPAWAELYGTFGARIGVEVLGGAVGARGGLDLTPSLRVTGAGVAQINAEYDSGGFAFEASAFAEGQMTARLGVSLEAEIYALYGAIEKRWSYPVASLEKRLGPQLRITFGRIAYARDGTVTWPNLSQIQVEPSDLDPLQVVREVFSSTRVEDR